MALTPVCPPSSKEPAWCWATAVEAAASEAASKESWRLIIVRGSWG